MCYSYKAIRCSSVEIIAAKFQGCYHELGGSLRNIYSTNDNGSFPLFVDFFFFYHREVFYRNWLYTSNTVGVLLKIGSSNPSRTSAFIPDVLVKSDHVAYFYSFRWCFVFSFCFVCLHPVSCLRNFASVPGLSVLGKNTKQYPKVWAIRAPQISEGELINKLRVCTNKEEAMICQTHLL